MLTDAAGNVVKSRMAPGELVQQPISWSGAITGSDRTDDWDEDGIAERFDAITKVSVLPGDVVEVVATSSVFTPTSLLARQSDPGLVWYGGIALHTADVADTWTFAVSARDENAVGAYELRWISGNAIVPTALVEYDFGYDKAGNLLLATEDQAAVAQVSALLPWGATITGPAAAGLGITTSYTVNALDQVKSYRQLSSGTNGIADVVAKRALYNYRDDGLVDTVSRYASDGTDDQVGTSTASYYGDSRLKGITHAPSSSESISYGYTYDAAGRMDTMTTPEGKSTFTLDAADQRKRTPPPWARGTGGGDQGVISRCGRCAAGPA